MTDNLEELERLLAKATPGPWEFDSERNEDCSPKHHDYFIGGTGRDGKWITLFDSVKSDEKLIEEEYDEDYHHAWDAVGKANAALIVALRNAAPSLIATAREVEGLRAEVARLKASNNALEHAVIKAAAPDYMTEAEREALHDFVQFLRSPEGSEARAALEGAEAPQSPIPLELKPIHFRLLERGANSRYIGLSNNSGVRMGEHAALGQLMRAGLVRFTEDSQPPGPRMPTPCEITDAGRAALEGKGD